MLLVACCCCVIVIAVGAGLYFGVFDSKETTTAVPSYITPGTPSAPYVNLSPSATNATSSITTTTPSITTTTKAPSTAPSSTTPTTDSIKIGDWTIYEKNGALNFKKGNWPSIRMMMGANVNGSPAASLDLVNWDVMASEGALGFWKDSSVRAYIDDDGTYVKRGRP